MRRLELLDGEDDLAREQLVYVDRDLRYYTARLESAIPVAMSRQPRRKVAFGAAVTVRAPERRRSPYVTIVGEDEADLKEGKISYVSPLAEALVEARVGSSVLWRRPAGNLQLTVEAIEYPRRSERRACGRRLTRARAQDTPASAPARAGAP